jgi:hypothetical protein
VSQLRYCLNKTRQIYSGLDAAGRRSSTPREHEREHRERSEPLSQDPESPRCGVERLQANGWPILQTAVAASLAYLLALVVLGNEQPFFAPIAAVISLGLTLGQRGRRAVEVVFGVAVGLMVADLIIGLIGVGALERHRA